MSQLNGSGDGRGRWAYDEYDGAGEKIVYRASSIGGCIRGLVASRLGIEDEPRPKPIQDAMDESSLLEEETIEWLAKNVGMTTDLQNTVTWELVTPNARIEVRGHIDCRVNYHDGPRVCDVKNVSDKQYQRFVNGGMAAFGNLGKLYDWQISAYMHATQSKGLWAVRNKLTGDVRVEEVNKAPISESAIEKRIREVETYVANEEYPPCDRGCSSWSPYWHIHEKIEPDKIEDEELIELISLYQQANDQKKELENFLKDAGDEIKHRLKPGVFVASGNKVTISRVNSSRFDSTAFKKEHRDLYEEFVVPKSYDRLLVDPVEVALGLDIT